MRVVRTLKIDKQHEKQIFLQLAKSNKCHTDQSIICPKKIYIYLYTHWFGNFSEFCRPANKNLFLSFLLCVFVLFFLSTFRNGLFIRSNSKLIFNVVFMRFPNVSNISDKRREKKTVNLFPSLLCSVLMSSLRLFSYLLSWAKHQFGAEWRKDFKQ